MSLRVVGEARKLLSPTDRTKIKRRAAQIFAASGSTSGEWSILLADDTFVRALNVRYRGKDRTTDVLSFPLATHFEGDAGGDGEPQLGDVIVSVPQALRQARQGDAGAELLRLLVHGFCHLRGLDHEAGKAEARRMWLEEARLCEAIGVKPRPQ